MNDIRLIVIPNRERNLSPSEQPGMSFASGDGAPLGVFRSDLLCEIDQRISIPFGYDKIAVRTYGE